MREWVFWVIIALLVMDTVADYGRNSKIEDLQNRIEVLEKHE